MEGTFLLGVPSVNGASQKKVVRNPRHLIDKGKNDMPNAGIRIPGPLRTL